MIIVSNTSPIFYLSSIDQLDLLRQLYGEIVIPVAVLNEITNVGNTDVSARVVPTLSWIKTETVADQVVVNRFRTHLDLGEAEAIALAIQLNADRLLIDERLGRAAALQVGIEVTGVLAILIAAKQNTLIPTVKPLLDSLISQVGFWIEAQLYAEVLRVVNESPEGIP